MPVGSIEDWLSLLRQEAKRREVWVDTDINGRIFHFHLGDAPGVIGKVRYSEEQSRNYENDQGVSHIWHRYNRELERIEEGSRRDVVNITLDVWSKDSFDPESHHFIFLTQEMINQDTYSQGDQKIWIHGDGKYEGPLSRYVNDWDALFNYATNGEATTAPADGSTPAPSSEDESGTIRESSRTSVRVSERFKRSVSDRFDGRCALTGINQNELLTVSHVLDRASHPEIAEDIQNALLLNWTHHMAYDAGLWTFDEAGRVWVNPEMEPESEFLRSSLTDHHGKPVDALGLLADKYVAEHNGDLRWWPLER